MSVNRQLSLFGVEASPPDPADLAGLVVAGAELDRRDGAVRASIAVDDPWRASALVLECARRALAATSVPAVGGQVVVRTAYTGRLVPLADAWRDAYGPRPPAGFLLDGRMLRLWVIATGRFEPPGVAYALALGPAAVPEQVGGALAAIGLGAALVSPRGGRGVRFRLVGRRRVARLAELVGEPPAQAPERVWPS
ncbi:MAG TPA: hypothetical protein VF163_00620 [Micromonosporaceae bacterium]